MMEEHPNSKVCCTSGLTTSSAAAQQCRQHPQETLDYSCPCKLPGPESQSRYCTWMEASGESPPWVPVSPCSPATKTYWSQWKWLYIQDGILVRRFYCLDSTPFYKQVVLPPVFWADVMRQMHEGFEGQIQSQLTTTQSK